MPQDEDRATEAFAPLSQIPPMPLQALPGAIQKILKAESVGEEPLTAFWSKTGVGGMEPGPPVVDTESQRSVPTIDVAGQLAQPGTTEEQPLGFKLNEAPKPISIPTTVAPDLTASTVSAEDGGSLFIPRPVVAHTAQTAVPAVDTQMQAPLNMGNGNWDKDLGNRIRWQVGGGQQTAEIKLSPPHLGALEIRVSVSNDQTHVQLVSHHAVVRDVMEANLPRLREMLAEQGMNQVNVNVSDQSLAQQRERGQAQTFDVVGGSQADDMDLSDSEAEPLTSRGSAGMGQVDYFA